MADLTSISLSACMLCMLIVCACILAHIICSRKMVVGGAPKLSNHVIVDLLNITHWFRKKRHIAAGPAGTQEILKTIDTTAPLLKRRWPGRVTYVVKDRTHTFNDESVHAQYAEAAERNKVVICIAEQYKDPPSGNKQSKKHSAAGRDDFYMCLLAQRERAVVVTEDRLKDFNEFRHELPPFHVLEFNYARLLPAKDFIRPESVAYAKMRRPKLVAPAEVFI